MPPRGKAAKGSVLPTRRSERLAQKQEALSKRERDEAASKEKDQDGADRKRRRLAQHSSERHGEDDDMGPPVLHPMNDSEVANESEGRSLLMPTLDLQVGMAEGDGGGNHLGVACRSHQISYFKVEGSGKPYFGKPFQMAHGQDASELAEKILARLRKASGHPNLQVDVVRNSQQRFFVKVHSFEYRGGRRPTLSTEAANAEINLMADERNRYVINIRNQVVAKSSGVNFWTLKSAIERVHETVIVRGTLKDEQDFGT